MRPTSLLVIATLLLVNLRHESTAAEGHVYAVKFTLTSTLPFGKVPVDPLIDFAQLLDPFDGAGSLDPNSIEVVNLATGRAVPFARTEDFAYSDAGRVEWVIEDPAHLKYEIRFSTADHRPPLRPQMVTPMIGVGDLLRYNASQPRPIALIYPSRLIDLTGDGRRDLVGCWNYAYRPGWPWDGIFCYPRINGADKFHFGDVVRVRYFTNEITAGTGESQDGQNTPPLAAPAAEFKHFEKVYMHADLADLNGDGRIDVVYSPNGDRHVYFYLNSGRRDIGGMPVFVASGKISRPGNNFSPVRAVDLNRDGAIDIVVDRAYLKNTNPEGWPIRAADSVELAVGRTPCFYDVDGDGKLDALSVGHFGSVPELAGDLRRFQVAWQQNLGGDPPQFSGAKPLPDLDLPRISPANNLIAVSEGPRRGIVVTYNFYSQVAFFEQTSTAGQPPRFRRFGDAESVSAVMSLSDQAAPWICDWDHDGDWDLLVGDGLGLVRILINEGDSQRPAFAAERAVYADGKPIQLVRNELLGEPHHPHNMGYTYPVYADWDLDGLPDLVVSNETNRIYWYQNVGTREQPKFGPRQQVLVDGYPDSAKLRRQSAELALKHTYPDEPQRPFHWRRRVVIVDMTGDGLPDLLSMSGEHKHVALYERYRDADGRLGLRPFRDDPRLRTTDGGAIYDESVLGRKNPRAGGCIVCADWDGDGLQDLVFSVSGWHRDGSLFLLRNCGSKTEPLFEMPRPIRCFGEPIFVTRHGPHPGVGDVDGDGRPDLICSTEWSVYPFYRHTALEMSERPRFKLGDVRRVSERGR